MKRTIGPHKLPCLPRLPCLPGSTATLIIVRNFFKRPRPPVPPPPLLRLPLSPVVPEYNVRLFSFRIISTSHTSLCFFIRLTIHEFFSPSSSTASKTIVASLARRPFDVLEVTRHFPYLKSEAYGACTLLMFVSRLAQLVERVTSNDEVSRSSRLMGTKEFFVSFLLLFKACIVEN